MKDVSTGNTRHVTVYYVIDIEQKNVDQGTVGVFIINPAPLRMLQNDFSIRFNEIIRTRLTNNQIKILN